MRNVHREITTCSGQLGHVVAGKGLRPVISHIGRERLSKVEKIASPSLSVTIPVRQRSYGTERTLKPLMSQRFHPIQIKDPCMNNVPLQPIIAILAGVLILLRPALLNYVVALYLIIIGILGIIGPRRL